MSNSQMRDLSEAVLTSMTEEEMATWRCQQGVHVICHQGRYWEEVRLGFYQPIHWMARLSVEQATRPTRLCWGFRAALSEHEAATANGMLPIHLLTDVKNYDWQSFSSNRRRHLRKCAKLVKIVELTTPSLLQEQGYEVLLSAVKRTQYATAPSKEDYLADLKTYIDPKHRLVLVGLLGDKLGGYVSGYAVDGIAYFERLYIATEALTTNINLGLVFEFVQVCRRSGQIRQVVNGLHSPEDPTLEVFKEGIGFPVKHVPTKVQINSIIGSFIRLQSPYVYYRLTGRDFRAR